MPCPASSTRSSGCAGVTHTTRPPEHNIECDTIAVAASFFACHLVKRREHWRRSCSWWVGKSCRPPAVGEKPDSRGRMQRQQRKGEGCARPPRSREPCDESCLGAEPSSCFASRFTPPFDLPRLPRVANRVRAAHVAVCSRSLPIFFPLDDTALAASCPHRPSASASLPRRWPSSPSRRPSLHLATPHPRFRALVPARSDSVLSFNRVGREGRGSRRPCTGRSHGGVFRGQECSQRPTEEK